jgi:hypothetical protein
MIAVHHPKQTGFAVLLALTFAQTLMFAAMAIAWPV